MVTVLFYSAIEVFPWSLFLFDLFSRLLLVALTMVGQARGWTKGYRSQAQWYIHQLQQLRLHIGTYTHSHRSRSPRSNSLTRLSGLWVEVTFQTRLVGASSSKACQPLAKGLSASHTCRQLGRADLIETVPLTGSNKGVEVVRIRLSLPDQGGCRGQGLVGWQ